MTTSPLFGQVVLGPPGSGKTTYVICISTTLREVGRNVVVVNLDSGNENLPTSHGDLFDGPIIDVRDLVSVADGQETLGLGPNGAAIFCFEFLESQMDWLVARMREHGPDAYFIFDMPGQVELISHHSSIHRILQRLRHEFDMRLTAVHLVDAIHAIDPARFVSVVLVSLLSMMRLALPHINVLSKIDLLDEADLAFPLEFYTSLSSIRELTPYIVSTAAHTAKAKKFAARRLKLYESLCDVIDEYGQVSYATVSVQEDPESVVNLIKLIDKSVGYVPVRNEDE